MQNIKQRILLLFFISIGFFSINSILIYANTNQNAIEQASTATTPGVTAQEIFLGSVLPLDGRTAGIGIKISAGFDAALAGQIINGRTVRILYADDLYEPILTPLKVRRLQKQGIFALLGNVGTPTTAAALPIIKQHGIPAVGFFTGTSLLRTGRGLMLNYRASYAQETETVIKAAIQAGVKPEQVCAYVQNDAYGKDGLLGMATALKQAKAPQKVIQGLETLLANSTNDWLVRPPKNGAAPINNHGPVGVYMRNHLDVLSGYKSLKNWEHQTSYRCKLVLAVGIYENIAQFIYESRDSYKENWIISAVSFVGANNLF